MEDAFINTSLYVEPGCVIKKRVHVEIKQIEIYFLGAAQQAGTKKNLGLFVHLNIYRFILVSFKVIVYKYKYH